ncbi:MAG: PQQ-like beta-propeller repeat protein [Alphaproteobacteria bacterium]|nr:PQQ-like beta-propeller repeat protein [Alphaproteobacteria bacterium]
MRLMKILSMITKRICPMPYALCLIALCACATKDPVLPGERHSVFDTGGIVVLDKPVPENALKEISRPGVRTAEYIQDSNNVVWRISGDERIRIFSGFPTTAHVSGERRPTVTDKYIFAGLSTGEVVKIDRATRNLVWVADIFKSSAMTGGSSILDVVAPVMTDGDRFVYAGGLGGSFCKLNSDTGAKVWCSGVGTGTPFIVRTGVSYVVGTDGYLYAIAGGTGDVFWRTEIKTQARPEFSDGTIIVGKEKFDSITGDMR